MEEVQGVSKVLDGFTVADTLVIRPRFRSSTKPARPSAASSRSTAANSYACTSASRHLHEFLEEKREALPSSEDKEKWNDMREFLQSANGKAQAALAVEKQTPSSRASSSDSSTRRR